MSDPRWLEEIRSTLARQGLPPEYVDRLVQELADHAEDIGDADPERAYPEELLGDPRAIASEAVSAFRSASWGGRHPVLLFVLGPLVIAAVGWGAYLALAIAGIELLTAGGTVRSAMADGLAWGLGMSAGLVVPTLSVRWLWGLYRPSGRPLGWYVGACFLLALLAGMFLAELVPPTPAGGGTVSFWLRLDLPWPWLQSAQFLAPLGLAGLIMARHAGRAIRGAGA